MSLPEVPPPSTALDATGRVSFERLRERTDELELIISGLSLFALLALPGWLWDQYETFSARLPMAMLAASAVLLPMASAICYVMALLFLFHLAVRAHWVGLIGLKAVFPDGIRWERLAGIGEMTRQRLQRRLPSLDQGIARADVIASTLFSLITFTALALAVLGLWLVVLFVIAGVFGDRLGGTNSFINLAAGWLIMLYMGLPLARWLLDGVLLRAWPGGARLAPLRGLVWLLGWLEGWFLPPRLLGATRLALQSNLLPHGFLTLFMAVIVAIAFFSNQMFQRGRSFDVFGTQHFIGAYDVSGGLRSGYYESLRVSRDALRTRPLIPAPMIETAWLPLFLPYTSVIDEPVLRRRCPPHSEPPQRPFGFEPKDDDAAAERREREVDAAAAATAECLRRLWEVRLDGKVQALDGFVASERADLGLRGLTGWLPLNGLAAGPHRLEVIWRPRPEQDVLTEDYVPQRIRHVIPFLWAPEAAAQPVQ